VKKSSSLVMSALSLCLAVPGMAADSPPPWAYGFQTPLPATPAPAAAPAPAPAPDPTLYGLPGAKEKFTRTQIGNRFGPADWFPGDHPAMPEVVAHGKQPDVFACSLCHYPNGRGRPENAPVAGLPEAYFIAQLNHFRNDERKSADPRKANTGVMATIAKGMTEAEMSAAAAYFGSMKFTPWVKVVESDTVPKTTTSVGLFLPVAGTDKEPIGRRILEVPEDVEAVEKLRNPRVGFIAYVPPGSVKKGEALALTGGGKSPLPCGTCHGPDLKGMLNIPAIAGRSPSYIVRQMVDMKTGHRVGPGTDLMRPIIANLDDEDMLAIAAYVASLAP
jgi:cytochrome c553